MKTIGIIGGVGPETTAKVYLEIIKSIRKSRKKNYPSIVIYNLPFPFILEDEAIIKGRNSDSMIPYLREGAQILKKAGATFGILPCNTLHKYIKQIRGAVKIPFLSIPDLTVEKLKTLGITNVGVLATGMTIESGIYGSIFEKNNITAFYPTNKKQKDINFMITELIKGNKNITQTKRIGEIIESMRLKGARAILLACTDLQMLIQDKSYLIPIIDTTEILIEASVRELTN